MFFEYPQQQQRSSAERYNFFACFFDTKRSIENALLWSMLVDDNTKRAKYGCLFIFGYLVKVLLFALLLFIAAAERKIYLFSNLINISNYGKN